MTGNTGIVNSFSGTSWQACSKRVLGEGIATALILPILNFLSQRFFNTPNFLQKEIVMTAAVLTLSSVGVREGIEGCLMKESASKTKKVFARLAGSLMGAALGVGLMSQSQSVFRQLALKSVPFKQVSLVAVTQFLSISFLSACIRFFLEESNNNKPSPNGNGNSPNPLNGNPVVENSSRSRKEPISEGKQKYLEKVGLEKPASDAEEEYSALNEGKKILENLKEATSS